MSSKDGGNFVCQFIYIKSTGPYKEFPWLDYVDNYNLGRYRPNVGLNIFLSRLGLSEKVTWKKHEDSDFIGINVCIYKVTRVRSAYTKTH